MKKVLVVVLVLVLAAAGVGYVVFSRGIGGADDWVVRKVVRVVETYIEPTIDFDSFDWDGSRTITLKDVTLTSDDGTEVVRAGAFVVELVSVPVFGGGPITIEALELRDYTVRLLQTEGEDGGVAFKGLVPFVKAGNIENQERVDEEVRLSNVLEIRRIDFTGGSIEYDAGDGSQPMRISGIDLNVDLNPTEAGLYELDVEFDRAPIFSTTVAGELNIDTMRMPSLDVSVNADLSSSEARSALPPQLQSLIDQYEVRGELAADLNGSAQLRDPLSSELEATFQLTDGNVSVGEYRYPVSGLSFAGTLANRRLTMPTNTISAIEGLVRLTDVSVDMSAPGWPARATWSVRSMKIQKLLRKEPDAEDARMAGTLSSEGSLTLEAQDIPASVEGSGTLTMREGRLVSIPVLSDLLDVMDVVARVTGTTTNKDKADVTFDLTGEGVEIEDMTIATQVAVVRSKQGTIFYDGALDLLVNAGPVEKLQEELGRLGDVGRLVGDVAGAVTDGLVKYDIEGTVGEPKIKVRPLGIGG